MMPTPSDPNTPSPQTTESTPTPPALPSAQEQARQLAQALNAEQERPLHPLSWLFVFLEMLKKFSLPIVFFWVSSVAREDVGNSYDWMIFGGILVIALVPIIHYLSYRFVIRDSEISIRWGIFNKQVRHIPLAKIHNVSLRRGIFHRLLDVAEVRLESAGSGQTSEALLRVLSLSDALLLEQAIEQGVFDPHSPPLLDTQSEFHVEHTSTLPTVTSTATQIQPPPLPSSEYPSINRRDATGLDDSIFSTSSQSATPLRRTLLTLSDQEIIRYGLVSNAGSALGGVITFIMRPEVIVTWVQHTLLPSDSMTLAWGIVTWFGLGFLAVASFIVFAKLISIISAYLSLHQFSLQDTPQYVTIEKGLLTRQKSRMPLDKIQVWRIEATWLHRYLDRQRLLIDTAILRGNNDSERGIEELVPIATPDTLADLLKRWADVNITDFDYAPVHPQAWRRIWLRYSAMFSAIWVIIASIEWAGGLVWSAHLSLPTVVTIVIILWLYVIILLAAAAHKRASVMGVYLDDQFIAWRDGWLNRRWIVTETRHCHGLRLSHSPFDRRYGMTTLIVDTVGGTLLQARFTLPYLPDEVAQDIQAHIVADCR